MPTISFLHPRVVADRRWSQSPPLGIDRPTEGREFETRRLRSFRTSPERVLFRPSWPAIQPAKHSARRKLSNAFEVTQIFRASRCWWAFGFKTGEPLENKRSDPAPLRQDCRQIVGVARPIPSGTGLGVECAHAIPSIPVPHTNP